ncbi:MAG TPA: MarR family transcriptional regulator [Solirubrobacterales bacterium]|nr:MarR family transcriptional regulator [Solirubrobacterales bacterium]
MTMSAKHLAAWRAVVTSHAAVTDRVQKALARADLPPLSWFEVLAAVEAAPEGRPRMSELAEYLTLSRGGITKLVDRLSDAGYLERVSCSDDRRSLQAELTSQGKRMLGEMRDVYTAELSRHLSTITAEEAELITEALARATQSTCDSVSAEEGAPALEAA